MLKIFFYMVSLSVMGFFVSCEKNEYKTLTGNVTLTGYGNLVDSFNNLPPVPLAGQKIYLNTGSDTSSYIFQTTTDSAGVFSIPSLKDDQAYILFARFIKNNIEFTGAIRFQGNVSNNTIRVVLNVYPSHYNGMSLLFVDPAGGPIPNFPFRLYTSLSMALSDSIKYSFVNTNSTVSGTYSQYNINPAKYYVVAKQVVGLDTIRIFDSLVVQSSSVTKDTLISNVYFSHYNGMSILFTDFNGGIIANLPFRLYTSRVMATYDSLKYAFANTNASINGIYNQYNVNPAKYYVVAKQVAGPDTLKIFDSLIVQPLSITKDTVILQ